MIYGPPIENCETVGQHLQNLTNLTLKTHQYMREKQNNAIQRAELSYNQNIPNPILIDDLVWLFTPIIQKEKGRKFSTFWTGPWRVIRKISNVLFEIRTEGNWNTKVITIVVSHDRIKPFVGPITKHAQQSQLGKDDLLPGDEDATVMNSENTNDTVPIVSPPAYLRAPRIWPEVPTKDHLQDETRVSTSSPPTSSPFHITNDENPNERIMHPYWEQTPTDNTLGESNLHEQSEDSYESVVPHSPSRQHAESSFHHIPTSGNIRQSSRIRGLHPQYLGVGSRNTPNLNPLYK